MKKEDKILFVGGCADAQKMPYLGREYRIPDYSEMATAYRKVTDGYPGQRDLSMTVSTYHIEQISFQDGDPVYFYRHESLTPKKAFKELLNGYRRSPFIEKKK